MGMQAGFTKYCCFLCLWDSKAVSQHYKQKDWGGSRNTFVPGEHSLKENPLVGMNKLLFPPLHIKLGLMKNFVKALHKNGAAFQHLSTVLLGLSAAKLKEGIFVEPRVREVQKDTDFRELLNLKELRAWEAFKSICSGFLGNTRVPDYQACIEKLLKYYEDMGCRMSLKIHFFHSRLNFFPPNLGAVSDEQNTPDLLRKHTFDCCGTMNCVFCHPSILIQIVFFIYPVLSVISCCNSWNMHIYSLFILRWDYLKDRKLEVIEQNYL